MYQQEVSHLVLFENLQRQYKVTPTLFMPLWRILGWTLGAASSAKGEATAMSCIEAVEDVIQNHYLTQIKRLRETTYNREPLLSVIKKCYEDEAHHRDIASHHGPHDPVFQKAVKTFTRVAIWLSRRL
jgi:ubiquinone biosynthesis monooxygenase Coq7